MREKFNIEFNNYYVFKFNKKNIVIYKSINTFESKNILNVYNIDNFIGHFKEENDNKFLYYIGYSKNISNSILPYGFKIKKHIK